MSFHKSNFGAFGGLPCDTNGYVPEATDTDPFAFAVDHGSERTHDESGELTEYGEWWAEEGFPAWRDAAVAATKEATASLAEWQDQNR